jgi:hypothetical protein
MKHGGGIKASIGCHTFRATGITAYLKNKGTLETAQQSQITNRPGRPSSRIGVRIRFR